MGVSGQKVQNHCASSLEKLIYVGKNKTNAEGKGYKYLA